MSTKGFCNVWRALWITPCLKWSSGRIGKRVAISLYEHKTIPIQFDIESLKNFKIRGESEQVAITKVVPNYISLLHKFSGIFSPSLDIFSAVNSISGDLILLWKRISSGPTCQ
jgi:hypothetical protein